MALLRIFWIGFIKTVFMNKLLLLLKIIESWEFFLIYYAYVALTSYRRVVSRRRRIWAQQIFGLKIQATQFNLAPNYGISSIVILLSVDIRYLFASYVQQSIIGKLILAWLPQRPFVSRTIECTDDPWLLPHFKITCLYAWIV